MISCHPDIAARFGPACGCCGSVTGTLDPGSARLQPVAHIDGEPVYRCDRHVGRNPCCIDGCGRTFAHQSDQDGRGPEDYGWRTICGKHWRQAPKFMRDAVARVRREAKRTGWSDRHHARHHRLWERCLRAILEGQHIDMREIERMFGPAAQ